MPIDVLLYWAKAIGEHFCHAGGWGGGGGMEGIIPCIPKNSPTLSSKKCFLKLSVSQTFCVCSIYVKGKIWFRVGILYGGGGGGRLILNFVFLLGLRSHKNEGLIQVKSKLLWKQIWPETCTFCNNKKKFCVLKNTVKARFTDTHLIWTPYYYRQFVLSLGKKALKFSLYWIRQT